MAPVDVEAFQAFVAERLHSEADIIGRPIMYNFTCQDIAGAGEQLQLPQLSLCTHWYHSIGGLDRGSCKLVLALRVLQESDHVLFLHRSGVCPDLAC